MYANEGGAGMEFVRQLFEGAVRSEDLRAAGCFYGCGIVCWLLKIVWVYSVLHSACRCGIVEGRMNGGGRLGVEKVWQQVVERSMARAFEGFL